MCVLEQKSVLFLLYITFSWRIQAGPLVNTSQGLLKGTTFETKNGRNISAFLGIPYAQPPVKELRFSSPVPVKSWDGIHFADKEANVCFQAGFSKLQKFEGDEDCLYLNVYTPILEFNSSVVNTLLPVMVWIHGGGFQAGNSRSTTYHPSHLLDKEIVLVSMNYRLGIFGFFSTGDLVAPGNFGLKDQVLALKWVQKNIQFFRGNPNRVTIFGESAGGASVNLHALSNATHGLFHQYIIQSGSALAPWAYRNRTHFKSSLIEVATKAKCPFNSSKIVVNCLRKKSAIELVNLVPNRKEEFPILPWAPTDELEAEEAFLTDSPQNLIAQNKMKDHPFISGTVVDEGLLVTLIHHSNRTSKPIHHLVEKCINLTSNHYIKSDNTSKFTKTVKDQYFNGSIHSLPHDKLLTNFTNFVGDSSFFYPQVILIEKMAKVAKSPVYFYSFGYLSINMSRVFEKLNMTNPIGVPHAEDESYIFPKQNLREIAKNDEKILSLMIDLWTSFAINGKPTSKELDDPNLWLPYAHNQSFLQIGNISNNTDPSVRLEKNYFRNRMNFWKQQFPAL